MTRLWAGVCFPNLIRASIARGRGIRDVLMGSTELLMTTWCRVVCAVLIVGMNTFAVTICGSGCFWYSAVFRREGPWSPWTQTSGSQCSAPRGALVCGAIVGMRIVLRNCSRRTRSIDPMRVYGRGGWIASSVRWSRSSNWHVSNGIGIALLHMIGLCGSAASGIALMVNVLRIGRADGTST